MDKERSSEQALEECQLYGMFSPLFNSSNFATVGPFCIYLHWTSLVS